MKMQNDDEGFVESPIAEEPKQGQQPQEQEQQPSRQEKDQEEFHRLVDALFDDYEPETALEEAEVIGMASALWSRRGRREFNSDTRRLDQVISGALARLSKSKAIRKAQERRISPSGIMRDIHRKNPQWGLIRRPEGARTRARPRRSKEALQFWAPLTSGRGFGSGLNPAESEEEKGFPRVRYLALYCKMIEGGLTADEQLEFDALAARDPVWHPARIEDHPLYESIQAWSSVVQSGEEEAATRAPARSQRLTEKAES